MVFESYISSGLSSVLTDYINNISQDDISLLLTSGQFRLTNLSINVQHLNSTILGATPVLLTHGTIGELSLGIQWKSLLTSTFGVHINDIQLCVAARPNYCIDEHTIEQSLQSAKQSILDTLQQTLLYGINTSETDQTKSIEPPPGTGIGLRIIAALINTVQFNINGLHIVVDHNSISSSARSQAEVLQLAGMQSTGKDTSTASNLQNDISPILNIVLNKFDFRTSSDGKLKDIEVDKFCVYIDQPDQQSSPQSTTVVHTDLYNRATQRQSSYLLYPFSTLFHMQFDNKSSAGLAVRIVGTLQQIQSTIGIAQTQYISQLLHPITTASTRIGSIQQHIQSQWKSGSDDVREEYIRLYKAKFNAMWLDQLNDNQLDRLTQIEHGIKQESLQLWRSYAIAELRFQVSQSGSEKLMKREDTVSTVNKLYNSVKTLVTGQSAAPIDATREHAPHQLTQQQIQQIRQAVLDSGYGTAPAVLPPVNQTNDTNYNNDSIPESSNPDQQPGDELDIPLLKPLLLDIEFDIQRTEITIVDDSNNDQQPLSVFQLVVHNIGIFSNVHEKQGSLRVGLHALYITDISQQGRVNKHGRSVLEQFRHLLVIESDVKQKGNIQDTAGLDALQSESQPNRFTNTDVVISADRPDVDESTLDVLKTLPVFIAIEWRADGMDSGAEQVGHAQTVGTAQHVDTNAAVDGENKQIKTHTTIDIEITGVKVILGGAVGSLLRLLKLDDESVAKSRRSGEEERMRAHYDTKRKTNVVKDRLEVTPPESAAVNAAGSMYASGIPNLPLPSLPSPLGLFPCILRLRVSAPLVILPVDTTNPGTTSIVCTATITLSTRLALIESTTDIFNIKRFYINATTAIDIISAQVFVYDYNADQPDHRIYALSLYDRIVHLTKLQIHHVLYPSYYHESATGPTALVHHNQLHIRQSEESNSAGNQLSSQDIKLNITTIKATFTSRAILVTQTYIDSLPLPSLKASASPSVITDPISLSDDDSDSDSEIGSYDDDHNSDVSTDPARPDEVVSAVQRYIREKEQIAADQADDESRETNEIISGQIKQGDQEETQVIPSGNGVFAACTIHIVVDDVELNVIDDFGESNNELIQVHVYDVDVYSTSFLHNRALNSTVSIRIDYYNNQRCVYEPVLEPMSINSRLLQHYTILEKDISEMIAEKSGRGAVLYPLQTQISITPSKFIDLTLAQSFLRGVMTFSAKLSVVNRRRSELSQSRSTKSAHKLQELLRKRSKDKSLYRIENCTELPITYDWISVQVQHNQHQSSSMHHVAQQLDQPTDTSVKQSEQHKLQQLKDLYENDKVRTAEQFRQANKTTEQMSEIHQLNRNKQSISQHQLGSNAKSLKPYSIEPFDGADDEQQYALRVVGLCIGEFQPVGISMIQPDTVRHDLQYNGHTIHIIVEMYVDLARCTRVLRVRGSSGIINHTQETIAIQPRHQVNVQAIRPGQIWWLPVVPSNNNYTAESIQFKPVPDSGEDTSTHDEAFSVSNNNSKQNTIKVEHQWSNQLLIPTAIRNERDLFREVITSKAVNGSSMSVVLHADNITGPRCPQPNDPCMSVNQNKADIHEETKQPEQMQDPQTLANRIDAHKLKSNDRDNNFGTLYCLHSLCIVENLTLSKLHLKWIPTADTEKHGIVDKLQTAVGLKSKTAYQPSDATAHSKADEKLHDSADEINNNRAQGGDRDSTIDVIDVDVEDLCHIYDNDMIYSLALSIGIPDILPGYWSDPIPFHVREGHETDKSTGYTKTQRPSFKLLDGNNKHQSDKYVDDDFNIAVEISKLHGINVFHLVIYHEYWLFNLSGLDSKQLGFSIDQKHLIPMSDYLDRLMPDSSQRNDSRTIAAVPIDFGKSLQHHRLYCGSLAYSPSDIKYSNAIDMDAVKGDVQLIDVSQGPDTDAIYNLAAVIDVGNGRQHRTKICTIEPAIFIVNTLKEDILVRQVDTNSAGAIVPGGQQVVYHYSNAMGSKPEDKNNERLVQFKRAHARYADWEWTPALDPDEISGDTVMGVRHSRQRDLIWFARAQVEKHNKVAYMSVGEHNVSPDKGVTSNVFHRVVNHTTTCIMRFKQVLHDDYVNKYDTSRDWLEVYPLQQQPYAYQYLRDGQKAVTVEVCHIDQSLSQQRWHKLGRISMEEETIDQKHSTPAGHTLYLSMELNGPKHVLYLRDYVSNDEDDWTVKQLGLTVPRPIHNSQQLNSANTELQCVAAQLQVQSRQIECERNHLVQQLQAQQQQNKLQQAQAPQSRIYLMIDQFSSKQSKVSNYRIDLQVHTLSVAASVQLNQWYNFNADQLNNESGIILVITRKKSLFHRHEKVVGQRRVKLSELNLDTNGDRPITRTIDIHHASKEKKYKIKLAVLWQQNHVDTLSQDAVHIAEVEDKLIRVSSLERHYKLQCRVLDERGPKLIQQRIDQHTKSQQVSTADDTWSEFRFEVYEIFDMMKVTGLIPDTLQQYRIILLMSTSKTFTTTQGIVLYSTQVQGHMSADTDIKQLGKQSVSFFMPHSFVNDEVLQCTMYCEPLQFSYDESHVKDVRRIDAKRDMEFLAQLPHRPVMIGSTQILLNSIPVTADLVKEQDQDRTTQQQNDNTDKSSNSKQNNNSDASEHGTTDSAGKRVMLPSTEQQIQLDRTLKNEDIPDQADKANSAVIDDREAEERHDDVHEITLSFNNTAPEIGELSMKLHSAHYHWKLLKSRPHISFSFYMPRFGLSIVNGVPEELLYISVDSMLARVQLTSERMNVQFVVNSFQVDDQLPDAIFPVLVSSKPTPPKSNKPPAPIFQLAFAQQISNSTALVLEFFTLQMQQILAQADEAILLALVNMLFSILSPGIDTQSQPHQRSLNELQSAISMPTPVFQAIIHQLIIQPILIELSFEPVMATRKQLENDLTAKYDLLLYLVSTGAAFASSVERAPIRIPGHQVDNLYGTAMVLGKRLFTEYKSDLLWQILLVGSNLNAIGQPTTAYQKIAAKKLKLLHNQPNRIQPHDSAHALDSEGNLPQRVWQAGFSSGAAVFSALAGGFAALSMDNDYAYELARRRHIQPVDTSDGFKQAAFELKTLPKQIPDHSGQHRSGAGKIAAGVLGVVGKPVAGVSAAVSDSLKGIGKLGDPGTGFNTATKTGYKDTADRIRPQRAIVSGVVVPYVPNQLAVNDSSRQNNSAVNTVDAKKTTQ